MKPYQIVLLVLAGAVGGAVVMKVMQPSQPAAPAPVVAQSQAPAAVPQAQPAPPVAEPAPQPVAPPAPVAGNKAQAKPKPARPIPERDPEPVATAAPTMPVAAVRPAPEPQAAPEPLPAAVSPPPPARFEPESVSPPPPPPPRQVTLNAGTLIPVRLIDGLSTERSNQGDLFTGSLDQPLVVDGLVIAERGARVEGRVASADRGGKVSGVASLAVQLTRIHLSDGQTISVETDRFERKAESSRKEDAAKVGGGAAIGAIIGAIAGGGKGAAVGAGVGGGAGAGDVLLTRGKAATLPSETHLSFRLSAPVTVTERR